MSRRFRFIAALLALAAFSAYFAEGVLAASCAPPSDTHADMVIDVGDTSGDCCAEAHGDAAAGDATDESHESHCPLGEACGAACAAVSVPGTAVALQPSVASSEIAFVPQHGTIQVLLTRSLYHPPRA